MNCSPTIAIALMLLSLTGGMFLLYKTKKESLGLFFKIMSWLIIVISIGSMLCCSVRCVFHGCGPRGGCGGMEQCEMGSEACGMGGHEGMEKKVIIMKGGEGECEMKGEGCCKDKMGCEEGKEECEEGKMDCCKKGGAKECEMEGKKECSMGGEKKCGMKMEKDTVVVKKK